MSLSLEVNSVAYLWLAVSHESNVEEEVVDARLAPDPVGSVARSSPGIVSVTAPVVADATWCHELAGPDGQASTIGHYEHAVHDSWSAKDADSFGYSAGSIARPSTVASSTGQYELSERVIASTDFLPASVQMPVIATPSGIPARRPDKPS